MKTVKAGCVLFNEKTKKVALVYREKYDDYSFPKGHLEKGESVDECALRETAEETKREAQIIKSKEPFIDNYLTPRGEDCTCYMFLAKDVGKSSNSSLDTHPVVWLNADEVEERLSYPSLKKLWKHFEGEVKKFIGK